MELWRRIIMVIFILTGIWLAYLASLEPMVVVRPEDFVKAYEKESRRSALKGSLLTDEDRPATRWTLQEYIAHETKDRLYRVEGKEWEDFFQNVQAVRDGRNPGKEWLKRLPNEQHPLRILYFRPNEPPIKTIANNLTKHLDTVYIALVKEQKTDYLKVEYKQYTHADFMIGSGFSPYPDPPSYMLYPYRKFSLWLILIGIAFYALLPRRKSNPQAIRYPLWRVILGDVIALLMIVPFFIIPILIVGGSKQTLTEGWPLLIFFWLIVLIGIWTLLKLSTWFAAYQILLLNDRIQLTTYRGQREFFFKDMEYFQPVIFKFPRWLIILLWIAALSGKGAGRIGGVGRAMIAGASEYGSTAIKLKDGGSLYINVTDAFGNVIFKGAEKIYKKLKEVGVQEKKDVKEIRSLGFETVRLPEKRI